MMRDIKLDAAAAMRVMKVGVPQHIIQIFIVYLNE